MPERGAFDIVVLKHQAVQLVIVVCENLVRV